MASYYDVLNIPKNSTDGDIKKAYRKLALKHHPDKGGDQRKFKEISEAYEVLGNPEKRQKYDRFGKQGLEKGFGDPFNMFASMFRREQKCNIIDQFISLTLEEIYKGKHITITFNIQKICDKCKGRGTKDGADSANCKDCHGSGTKTYTRQLAPGFVQQIRSNCDKCNGSGKIVDEKDKCLGCHGKQTVLGENTIEFNLQPGFDTNQMIGIKSAGHQHPDKQNGDVRIIVKQLPHPIYKRNGQNLIVEKKITLLQALCGFKFKLKGLDGKTRTIKCGKVIDKKEWLVSGKGLKGGNLIFHFSVEYPKELVKDVDGLSKILGFSSDENEDDDEELLEI